MSHRTKPEQAVIRSRESKTRDGRRAERCHAFRLVTARARSAGVDLSETDVTVTKPISDRRSH